MFTGRDGDEVGVYQAVARFPGAGRVATLSKMAVPTGGKLAGIILQADPERGDERER